MEHGLVPYEEQPRSPPLSAVPTSPSLSLRRKSSPLSLDLSCVPPLITPKPPSNTLLLTVGPMSGRGTVVLERRRADVEARTSTT